VPEHDWTPPAALREVANLDFDRADRRGYPEAVYCESKTVEQLTLIATAVRERKARTLFTRATPDQAVTLQQVLPDPAYDPEARLLWWPAEPPEPTGGLVVVAAAGTSDLPVAREALQVARVLGRNAELVPDVGVAGLHRILGRLELLRSAAVPRPT